MIQNRFRNIIEGLKGQIKNEFWSAPCLHGEESPEIRMLLAVSGGMDSMCMADLFHQTFGSGSFAIAHCNFNLRGEESDGDEALVRNWAEERGIVLHTVSFETEEFASSRGISIEMAARELRYGWFASLCESEGYTAVAVAHHAEDNAETLLLNLVRGTGMKGITGMKPCSPLPYSRQDGYGTPSLLVRPMLSFTRKQIEGYVLQRKVPYRTDSTNASVEYRRNRIRHEVFPSLRKLNPSFVSAFNREMTYFADAQEIVTQWCRERMMTCVSGDESAGIRISLDYLLAEKQWRYLLYHILEPYGFNSSVLSSIEELLVSGRTCSGKIFLSGINRDSGTWSSAVSDGEYEREYVLTVERTELVVRRRPSHVSESSENVVTVYGPGEYRMGEVEFTVELLQWDGGMKLKQPAGVLVFDASVLAFPFVCRSWSQGDWMIPFGMRGRKKISDMFADLKYGTYEKASSIMIVKDIDDGHVAGLMGVRIDDRYKVNESTKEIIKIILKNQENV